MLPLCIHKGSIFILTEVLLFTPLVVIFLQLVGPALEMIISRKLCPSRLIGYDHIVSYSIPFFQSLIKSNFITTIFCCIGIHFNSIYKFPKVITNGCIALIAVGYSQKKIINQPAL